MKKYIRLCIQGAALNIPFPLVSTRFHIFSLVFARFYLFPPIFNRSSPVSTRSLPVSHPFSTRFHLFPLVSYSFPLNSSFSTYESLRKWPCCIDNSTAFNNIETFCQNVGSARTRQALFLQILCGKNSPTLKNAQFLLPPPFFLASHGNLHKLPSPTA